MEYRKKKKKTNDEVTGTFERKKINYYAMCQSLCTSAYGRFKTRMFT